MIRLIEKVLDNEIIRYIFIGGCTTAVNFATFWIIYELLGVNVTISNICSITLSIIFAYITNRTVVFRSVEKAQNSIVREFTKFFCSRIFTMLLEIGGVYFIIEMLKQDPMVGKLAAQFLVLVCNYIISKFIVFK